MRVPHLAEEVALQPVPHEVVEASNYELVDDMIAAADIVEAAIADWEMHAQAHGAGMH